MEELPDRGPAMSQAEDDVQYYQRRAEEEIARAQCAVDPEAVSLHYQLSELLLARVSELKGVERSDKNGE